MTPAVKLLQKKKINFQIYEYRHDPNHHAYGLEAAEYLASEHNVTANQVFKTLVVQTSNNELVVAIVCVTSKLNLKAIAKELRVKKVKMAEPQLVLNSTGYVLGGVSPLGQKNKLKTLIDVSITDSDTIYVSAGKRGLEIALAPKDIIELTNAKVKSISI